jgi:TolB-like protein
VYGITSSRGIRVILLGCFFLLTACSHGYSPFYVDKNNIYEVRKVAVFPFRNLSKNPHAREIVTQIFLAELSKKGRFEPEELGNVIDFMVEQKIRVGVNISKPGLFLLKRRYKIDAVIFGDILVFEQKGETPYISLSVRMVKIDTDKIVWKANIERNGDDYIKILNIGQIRSLNQLTSVVVRELMKTIR